jgi:hypothetical protein
MAGGTPLCYEVVFGSIKIALRDIMKRLSAGLYSNIESANVAIKAFMHQFANSKTARWLHNSKLVWAICRTVKKW